MAGSQSKQGGGGCLGIFAVLVVLGLIITYWEIALAIAGAAAILFVLVRFAGGEDQQPNWSAAGGWTAAIVAVVVGAIVLGNAGDDGGDRSANRSGNAAQSAGTAGSGGGGGDVDLDGDGLTDDGSATSEAGTGGFPTARVTRVIDGDTVETDAFGDVRLIGVDTPEEGKCHDNAATQFTRGRLEGEVVGVEFDQERTDRYGRALAYLYRGGMHNLALLENGHAEVLTIPPNDRYEQQFERAEQEAKGSGGGGEGLWSACDEPEPAPTPPSSGGDGDDESSAPAPDPEPVEPSGGGGGSGGFTCGPGDIDGDGDGLCNEE